jgi:hypothetical protein
MPRDAFRDIAPVLDAACGSVLDTPLGHLLGDYMLALERHLPAVLVGQSLTNRAANSRPYRLARNLYMPRLEKSFFAGGINRDFRSRGGEYVNQARRAIVLSRRDAVAGAIRTLEIEGM